MNLPINFEASTVVELLDLLKEKDGSIRKDAAEELGARRIRSTWRALRPLLQDPWWVVRCSAAESLGMIRAKEAIPDLRRVLPTRNMIVKGYVSLALAKLGDEPSRPIFEAMIRSRSERSRLNGAEALYVLGDRARLLDVIEGLTSADYRIQFSAKNAIVDIVRTEDMRQAIKGLRVALAVERIPARIADFRSALRDLESR